MLTCTRDCPLPLYSGHSNAMAKPSYLTSGLIVTWLLASSLGFLAFGAYHASPSRPGSPPGRWPAGTPIPRHGSLPTLLIFIHPRCPCSAASLAELERLSARFRGRFDARMIAYRPEEGAEGWEASDSPPTLSSWVDVEGREAARFGVETSGHVLLFAPSGRRLFSGGITIARGHRGDNPGLDRLIAAIRGGSAEEGTGPVFGCPIHPPSKGRPGRPSR